MKLGHTGSFVKPSNQFSFPLVVVLLVPMLAERNGCYGCLDANLLVLFAKVKFLSLIINSGLVAIRMLSDYSYLVNFESRCQKGV